MMTDLIADMTLGEMLNSQVYESEMLTEQLGAGTDDSEAELMDMLDKFKDA